MEEIIVGVVGVLQFDVLKYRLKNEYNVEIILENLPYEHIRWIENEDVDLDHISGTSDMKKIKDLKDRPLLLFIHEWSIRMTLERNEGLVLSLNSDAHKMFFFANGAIFDIMGKEIRQNGRF